LDEIEVLEPAYLFLRAGSSRHDEGGTVHAVAQVIPHQLYDPEMYDYDIALLKVGDQRLSCRRLSLLSLSLSLSI
jgi:hypothetical protein